MKNRLLTPAEVAEHVGVSKDLIYKEIRAGRLNHVIFGTLIRIYENDLNKYLNQRTKRNVQNRRSRKTGVGPMLEPLPRVADGKLAGDV